MRTTDEGGPGRRDVPEDAVPPEPAGPGADGLVADGLDPALAGYATMSAVALSDAERWPALSPAQIGEVTRWADDPAAPVWVHRTGDRLTEPDLQELATTADRLAEPPAPRVAGGEPDWVPSLVERVHAVVPHYRGCARVGASHGRSSLADVAPVSREDLVADVSAFVPVDVPLDRVLEGSSSGSAGAALTVPLHPVAVAADVLLIRHLLAGAGVEWRPEPGRLSLLNLVDQEHAFTYVSAITALWRRGPDARDGASGGTPPVMARVNLHAGQWRRPGDRERFLERANPQVVSASPAALLALLELARAGLELRPLAVVSGAAHLTPAVRAAVRRTWGVPVVDLYGLRETGAVAARTDDGPFAVVPRRVYVEALDARGRRLPEGEVGELAVTVGENPYLPLLRYRTGDQGAVTTTPDGRQLIDGLEGRAPVRFARADGTWMPSVDATQLLQAYGMAAWRLHQDADGSVHLAVLPDPASAPDVVAAADAPGRVAELVAGLLGRPVDLTVCGIGEMGPGKARRFSSALDPQVATERAGGAEGGVGATA